MRSGNDTEISSYTTCPDKGNLGPPSGGVEHIIFSMDQMAMLSEGVCVEDSDTENWPFYQLALNDERLHNLLDVSHGLLSFLPEGAPSPIELNRRRASIEKVYLK